MYSSPGPVALVPTGVVTVTSTVPLPGGETAVIDLPETTVKLFASLEPKWTDVAAVKPLPVIVTALPGGALTGRSGRSSP